MGVLKAIFMITATLIDLALCDDQVMSFELSLPDVMSSFITIDEALRTLQGADVEMKSTNTLAENVMLKVQWKAYDYISKMLNLQRRKNQVMRPRVEYGVGFHKTDVEPFQKNVFEKRLKTLIKMKQQKGEKNKNAT